MWVDKSSLPRTFALIKQMGDYLMVEYSDDSAMNFKLFMMFYKVHVSGIDSFFHSERVAVIVQHVMDVDIQKFNRTLGQ